MIVSAVERVLTFEVLPCLEKHGHGLGGPPTQ